MTGPARVSCKSARRPAQQARPSGRKGVDHISDNNNDPPPDGVPHRLLILDDDALIGETLQHMADFCGLEARFVTAAGEFFALLESWAPHIVAVDLVMPGMDGVEVIRQLGEQRRPVGLIITSGIGERVMDAAERSARAHGLDIVGLLPKPFTATALRQLLDEARQRLPSTPPAFDIAEPAPQPAPAPTVDDLREALARNEISVAYQPKVHCRTGTLVGFEGLARWRHPRYGPVAPDVFVPLAEANGLIDDLTCQVSEQALAWLATLSGADATPCGRHRLAGAQLSLNVSAASLGNQALFAAIADHCRALGIAPQRVVLELTETSAMQDPHRALDNLTHLRLQGFQLSIDDFGTGYSSMVQLVKLPFTEIKVDKSFVMTAAESEESRAVVRSIIELGRSLRLSTTAEGVEDAAALAYLNDLGCDHVQGYGIARPLAADEVVPWFVGREREREARRLAAVHALGQLDTPPEARFDRVTRLARRLFSVATAAISLIDHDRLWFKSRQGPMLDGFAAIPRSAGFCDATIETDGARVVADARTDPGFRDNPLVTGPPFIRFYAGQPVYSAQGDKLGALCLLDTGPQRFSDLDAARLARLAESVTQEFARSGDADADDPAWLLDRDVFQRQAAAAIDLSRTLALDTALVRIHLLDLPRLNQQHGTAAGDALIRDLGVLVNGLASGADVVGRRRGSEIAALFIDPEDLDILALCEALRLAVEDRNAARADTTPRMVCEITCAHIPATADGTLDQMLRAHPLAPAVIVGA